MEMGPKTNQDMRQSIRSIVNIGACCDPNKESLVNVYIYILHIKSVSVHLTICF